MSVTFSPVFRTNVPHTLTCLCGSWTAGVQYDTFQDAHSMASVTTSTCVDDYCDNEYVYPTPVIAEPEVQLSNSNAATLLDVLGIRVGEDFSDRCSGSMSASDMRGRILLAQALNPTDVGSATIAVGNVVDCGRPEGYTDAKLSALAEVVDFAERNNLEVTWG